MNVYLGLIQRELLIGVRSGSEALVPLAFFALVIFVFALTFGTEKELLARCTIPILWITALFANTLSLDNLFRRDHDDGTLALTLLSFRPSIGVIAVKLVTHWVITALPICLFAPLVGKMFGLSWEAAILAGGTLAIGTLSMTLIGALVAALLVGVNRGGQILLLIVVPIYLPVLLLGVGISTLHAQGMSYSSPLLGSLAILSAGLTCVPIALKPLLKTAQDS